MRAKKKFVPLFLEPLLDIFFESGIVSSYEYHPIHQHNDGDDDASFRKGVFVFMSFS